VPPRAASCSAHLGGTYSGHAGKGKNSSDAPEPQGRERRVGWDSSRKRVATRGIPYEGAQLIQKEQAQLRSHKGWRSTHDQGGRELLFEKERSSFIRARNLQHQEGVGGGLPTGGCFEKAQIIKTTKKGKKCAASSW